MQERKWLMSLIISAISHFPSSPFNFERSTWCNNWEMKCLKSSARWKGRWWRGVHIYIAIADAPDFIAPEVKSSLIQPCLSLSLSAYAIAMYLKKGSRPGLLSEPWKLPVGPARLLEPVRNWNSHQSKDKRRMFLFRHFMSDKSMFRDPDHCSWQWASKT